VKNRKIWSKRIEDDGGTVKTGNTDKSADFSENRHDDFQPVFVGTQPFFCQKSVNGTKKL
jgi:hypothetical protein